MHHTPDDGVGLTLPGPHVLSTVGEVVQDPGGEVVIHPRELQETGADVRGVCELMAGG